MKINLYEISATHRHQCWSDTFDNVISGFIEESNGDMGDTEVDLLIERAKKIADAAHGELENRNTKPASGFVNVPDLVVSVQELLTPNQLVEFLKQLRDSPVIRTYGVEASDKFIYWRNSISDLVTDIRRALPTDAMQELLMHLLVEMKDSPFLKSYLEAHKGK